MRKHTHKTHTNVIKDEQLAEWVRDAISWKLLMGRTKGRHGWWDQDVCSIDALAAEARQLMNQGRHQYLDAAILMLMVAYRMDKVEGSDG